MFGLLTSRGRQPAAALHMVIFVTAGSGAEATEATNGEPKSNGQDPRSDYGGEKGEPKESSDIPTSSR